MTIHEAQEALTNGAKITYKDWSNDEFVYLKNGLLLNEINYSMNLNFWKNRIEHGGFNTGWKIYFENKY